LRPRQNTSGLASTGTLPSDLSSIWTSCAELSKLGIAFGMISYDTTETERSRKSAHLLLVGLSTDCLGSGR